MAPVSAEGPVSKLRERYGVPDGVRLRADGAEILAFLPEHEIAVRRVASDPGGLPPSEFAGRAPLARVETSGGEHLVVRAYRKGGLLRSLRGATFWGPMRPLQELVLHRRLRAAGVPVLEAVGAVVLRSGVGWRGFLLTREVAGGLDLEAWLHGVPAPTDLHAARILRRAGRAVRAVHDAGVAHADLHPKNMLITRDGEVLVLDLDRARSAEGPLDDESRLANLVRLGRAIEKHRLKGMTAGRRFALRFLEGYAGGREAAGEWLERIRARLGRGLALRRAWWRFKGEARPWSRGPSFRKVGS
jgi:tRNA A-37 threonylcarbamoyl transferase component Bud32